MSDAGAGEVVPTELLKQNYTTVTSNPDRWTFYREEESAATPNPASDTAISGSADAPGSAEERGSKPARQEDIIEQAPQDDLENEVDAGEEEEEEEEEGEEAEGEGIGDE